MYKKIFLVLIITNAIGAMQPPQAPMPANRFFLRDLMEAYQNKRPLDLEKKSQATITDIQNWIEYAGKSEKARAEFAREFNSTSEEIGLVLDILDAEIKNRGNILGSSAAQVQIQPAAAKQPVMAKPAPRPLPVPPTGKAPAKSGGRLPIKPGARPLPVPRFKPPQGIVPMRKPAAQSLNAYFIQLLENAKVVKNREGNFVQVKTVDQFNLGQDIGPATCPVQALRNVIILLRFVNTGLTSVLDLLQDPNDARVFLDEVGKCGVGTQWLTAEEIGRILNKMEGVSPAIRNDISALDTVQEINLYPEKLKALNEKFKQPNASHGFIIGTMDVGQYTNERGHYFALVIKKSGPEYLYLIADTAPANDHLNPNNYDYKRIKFLTDLVTKGKSDINLDNELQKMAGAQYQDILARALQRGAQFDFKSLSRNEAEGLDRLAQEAERNRNEWKNRTRFTDEQLTQSLQVVRKKLRERLTARP